MKKSIFKYLLNISLLLFLYGGQTLQAKQRFPILASHALKDGYGTLENYRNIENAGFTIAFEYFTSRNEVLKHLKVASKTKVKLIVWCPELNSDLEETIRLLKKYKSFGGYYISDEPGAKSFPALKKRVEQIRTLDSKHYLWINLFPNYSSIKQIEARTYEDYVSGYLDIVKPPILSFDHYGLLKKGLRRNYYSNLEVVAKLCKKNDTPFWAYVLASEFGDHVSPTRGTLSFQAYSNIAYGAQGIEYFSYRRIIGAGLNITMSPVDTNYQKMPIYEAVKAVNDEIQYYSKYFLGNSIVEVTHTGGDLPIGTKELRTLPAGIDFIESGDRGFVVSHFVNRGHEYLLFVNKDYENYQKLSLNVNNKVKRISYYSAERKRLSGCIDFDVRPGSIVLLKLK